MNLGLAATAFAVVIPAELPDKTFISAVVLSARHRPWPVWAGASAGLVVQAGLSAAAGRLVALAPHRVVEGLTALAFLAGAALLLLRPERDEVETGRLAADAGEEQLEEAPGGATALSIFLVTFGVIVVAEFGDLTQILVANLSARERDPLSVFAGASVAFVIVSGVGVIAGRTLTRVVPLALVRKLSGVVFLGLGVLSAVGALS